MRFRHLSALSSILARIGAGVIAALVGAASGFAGMRTAVSVHELAVAVARPLVALVAAAQPHAVQGAAKEHGQTLRGDALVDFDYAFQLTRPSVSWTTLDEDDAAHLHYAALAGLNGEHGIAGYVLVTKVPKIELAALQTWLVDWAPIGDRTVLERKSVRCAGQDAFCVVGFGDLHGARVRFRLQAFLSKGYLYLLFAHGPIAEIAAPTNELQPFFDAFALTAGAPRARNYDRVEHAEAGVDWSFAKGVFSRPLCGLEIDVPDGWRTALPGRGDVDEAWVGFVSREPQATVFVSSEIVDPTLEKAWLADAALRSPLALADGTPPSLKPPALELGGGALQTRWHDARADPLHRVLGACGVQDAVGRRVWMRVVRGEEQKGLKALQQLLGGARRLSSEQRAERTLALHARGESDASLVGPTGFLRNGRYKDYAAQFTLELPRGPWLPQLFTSGGQGETFARLALLDASRAITGFVFALTESDDSLTIDSGGVRTTLKRRSLRSWCESLLAAYAGPELDAGPAARRANNVIGETLSAGPSSLFTIAADYERNGVPQRAEVLGVERNKRLVFLVWDGPRPSMLGAARAIRASASSFRWFTEKEAPRRIRNGWFEDEQLDIALDLAGEAWKFEPGAATDKYACELQGPKARMLLFELRAALAYPSADAIARDLRQRFGESFGGIAWAKPTEFDSRVQELPARVWRFDGPSGRIEVDAVLAHGLVCGVVFVREGASDAAADEFLPLKRRLRFGDALRASARTSASAARRESTDEPRAAEPAASKPGAAARPGDGAREPGAAPKEGDADVIVAKPESRDAARQPDAGVLELPPSWRPFSLADTYCGLDFGAQFRARADWFAALGQRGLVRAHTPEELALPAFVRAAPKSSRADTLGVERFERASADTDAARIADEIAAVAKASGATDVARRELANGRLGSVHVVEWSESAAPPAALAARKTGAATASKAAGAQSATPARRISVYVLCDESTSAWSITLGRASAARRDDAAPADAARAGTAKADAAEPAAAALDAAELDAVELDGAALDAAIRAFLPAR